MIKFQRITTTDAALYKYMEQLMTASFPSEEYRPLEELRNYSPSKYSGRLYYLLGFRTFLLCRAFCH